MPDVDKTLFLRRENVTENFVEVTPSDTVPVLLNGKYPRGFYVGSGGDLELVNGDGVSVIWQNVPTGTIVKGVSFAYVMAASTTASGIIAIG